MLKLKISKRTLKSAAMARAGKPRFPACLGKSIPPSQVGTWLIVQPGRYRYTVDWQTGIDVRMVIGEYLACRVVWNR